ncbi:MAG: hypothetical protein L0Y35_09315 [Flammeovirgaceae bacterium]|nr:hypothetical protein [Flammeovirgaceae bacterium]
MRSAYNETWLHNLRLLKEVKRWKKKGIIPDEQFTEMAKAYPVHFYHPNFIIRILLIIATLLALSGVTGFFALIMPHDTETTVAMLCILYGFVSWIILEKKFIKENHFKSGVNEAILYHSIGFIAGGIALLMDFDSQLILWGCLILLAFAAYRYLDLLCTLAGLLVASYLLFHNFYELGGIMQQLLPFVFIAAFTPFYFFIKKIKSRPITDPWMYCLLIIEAFSLLMIYLAGNYFVVRELSIELMGLALEPGQEIPFAFVFYGLTVLIPIGYLYAGIKNKDQVLMRVSLVVLAFSVFTFKYYYSTGHHEITFTTSGIILITISLLLLRYLKTPRNGYTCENILEEKWANANAEAFIISQTLGGNKITTPDMPGGGASGGAGSSDSF